jgi:plastocyanin
MARALRAASLALLACATLGACGKSSPAPPSLIGATVQVFATDNRFSPAAVQAAAGRMFTLRVNNDGLNPHNVSIAGDELSVDVPPEGSRDIRLRAPAAGTSVTFFCRFHRDTDNMQGTIGGVAAEPSPA